MENIKDLLADAALEKYAEIFEEVGYDSLPHLLAMGPSELTDLKRLTKMKSGHFVRLQSTIEVWRVPATPSTGSTPSNSMSVGPVEMVEMGPEEMGPPEMAAAATGPTGPTGPMGRMGPSVPVEVGPQTLSSLKSTLRKTYNNWAEARLASLNYSTFLECSVMLENNKSGGNRKVLRCRTALSKNKRGGDDADGGPECPHYLLWTKNKTGDWKLNWKKSNLEHKAFCESGQLVTKDQLVHDPEFVRSLWARVVLWARVSSLSTSLSRSNACEWKATLGRTPGFESLLFGLGHFLMKILVVLGPGSHFVANHKFDIFHLDLFVLVFVANVKMTRSGVVFFLHKSSGHHHVWPGPERGFFRDRPICIIFHSIDLHVHF